MTTDMNPIITSAGGDAQAVIDTALRSAAPTEIEPGKVYAVGTPSGVETLDLDLDKYRATPRRKAGSATVFDGESFLAYYSKHKTDSTDVWADVERFTVAAVFNAAGTKQPGWGDHTVTLSARKTQAWCAWESRSGRVEGQVAFAEHIEDRVVDFVNPTGADMLEIAQTFEAKSKVDFESAHRLASGQRQISYRETTEAKAGVKGSLTIPESFELALIPFEGAGAYKVTARLRYRISDGQLRIGYVLDRPDDVLRSAFDDVLASIGAGIEGPLLKGRA